METNTMSGIPTIPQDEVAVKGGTETIKALRAKIRRLEKRASNQHVKRAPFSTEFMHYQRHSLEIAKCEKKVKEHEQTIERVKFAKFDKHIIGYLGEPCRSCNGPAVRIVAEACINHFRTMSYHIVVGENLIDPDARIGRWISYPEQALKQAVAFIKAVGGTLNLTEEMQKMLDKEK